MDDEILTLEEAAELLKIPQEKVLDLLMSADLQGRNIGGVWRTTKRAIVSFVDGAPIAGSGCCGANGTCCVPLTGESQSGQAERAKGWS